MSAQFMLVVIENGYGKRIRVSEIRRTKPGAVGVKGANELRARESLRH